MSKITKPTEQYQEQQFSTSPFLASLCFTETHLGFVSQTDQDGWLLVQPLGMLNRYVEGSEMKEHLRTRTCPDLWLVPAIAAERRNRDLYVHHKTFRIHPSIFRKGHGWMYGLYLLMLHLTDMPCFLDLVSLATGLVGSLPVNSSMPRSPSDGDNGGGRTQESERQLATERKMANRKACVGAHKRSSPGRIDASGRTVAPAHHYPHMTPS